MQAPVPDKAFQASHFLLCHFISYGSNPITQVSLRLSSLNFTLPWRLCSHCSLGSEYLILRNCHSLPNPQLRNHRQLNPDHFQHLFGQRGPRGPTASICHALLQARAGDYTSTEPSEARAAPGRGGAQLSWLERGVAKINRTKGSEESLLPLRRSPQDRIPCRVWGQQRPPAGSQAAEDSL